VCVEGAVLPDTTVSWQPVSRGQRYIVHRRRTDAADWERALDASMTYNAPLEAAAAVDPAKRPSIKLGKVRVDDWTFGASSVSADGYESPVSSAVPGGAWRPLPKAATK
jgi:hypothetical protein